MRYRICLMLITGLVHAGPVAAQLNESDTVRLQLRTGLTGNYQQGNVNIFTLRGRADMVWTPVKHWVFKTQNSHLYQEFGGKKADNDLFSRNYIYYRPQRRLYPFGIAWASANYRRKIESRVFAGGGITWQALCKKYHVIKLSGGLVYESTRFNGNRYNQAVYNGSNRIAPGRGSLYMAGWHYVLNKKLKLYYDAFWQPAFHNRHNYRTQYDLGADMPLWKGLSVTALYTVTRETVVISGIQAEDRILSFGVAYQFRKGH